MRLSALVLGFLPVLSLAAAIDRPGDKPGGNLPDGKPPGPPGGGNGNNTSGNKPGPGPGPGPGHDRDRELDAAASRRIDQMEATYQRNLLNSIKGRKTGCTSDKLLKRREWGTLSKRERLDYIDAVYCLHSLPGRTPQSVVPGARTRFDDFVVSHMEQTTFVHASGLFLGFHRHFVYLYEKALREECGYRGTQPYWDWTISYKDPEKSTVFDGSPWSMGSNGIYIPDRQPWKMVFPGNVTLWFPPATGGGCVYSGPFTPDKFLVHLGPIGLEPQGPGGGYDYNPRCLTRDISPPLSLNQGPRNVTALLEGPGELGGFLTRFEAPVGGLHGNGHFVVGTVQADVYASPGDPAFWLHHAQVDRMWSIWQGQNFEKRMKQVWGTQTSGNVPPSDNVTLSTPVNFGSIGPSKVIEDLVSTVDGEYCYIYE